VAVSGNPFQGDHKIRSVGLPYPDIDVKIVHLDDDTQEVAPGEVGELVISSPSLMVGYHGMPTETNNAIRKDEKGRRWLYTGDIARMDDEGYLYIVDRKKDMALIGGFNVYPTQIEDALKRHPAVLEVGVAAVPHPEKHGQEALKAWVVPKPGETLTDDDLITHCKEYLAAYEIPRRYAFVDEIPKTAVGKTLRRELIQQEMTDAEQQTGQSV
jgi:long-chain acyl-CoA synthetase